MKVSYSCMDNMKKVINSHSKYVAPKKDQVNQNLCNCRNPDNCPLDNKCLTSKIVYSVEIITDDQQLSKFYLGICETEFKTRFNNHKSLFVIGRTKKIQNYPSTSGSWKTNIQNIRLDGPLPENQVATTLYRNLVIFVYRRNSCYVISVTRAD